jgi:hypothetical protein
MTQTCLETVRGRSIQGPDKLRRTKPVAAACHLALMAWPKLSLPPRVPRSRIDAPFDLHRGLDMSEEQIDTIPAEPFDELFKR